MPDGSGSRCKSPGFSLKWGTSVKKARKFEIPSLNTFCVIEKNDRPDSVKMYPWIFHCIP